MKNRLFAAALLLCIVILPWQLQALERLDLLENEPFILQISNIPAFFKALEQSAPGKLWNSKEMKPFLNNQSLGEALKNSFLDSMYKGKSNEKQLAHLSWEQFKLAKGELVVGISPRKTGGVSISVVSSITKGDYDRTNQLGDRMAELDEDLGDTVVEEFQGIRMRRRELKGADGEITLWSAFTNGTSIDGSNREWVEQCILKLKKEGVTEPSGPPSLHIRGTAALLKNFLFPERPAPSLPGHLEEGNPGNGGGEEGTPPPQPEAAPAPPAPEEPKPDEVLKALGLDKLDYISLDFILNPKNLEFVFNVKQVPSPDPSRGLWALLVPETGSLSPDIRLPYVPEDIYSYQVVPLNFGALWKEIPEILTALNPQNAAQFNSSINMFAAMYQVDVGRDIFSNLGNHVITFTRMEGITKQDIYAFRMRDPLAMEKVLARLLGEGSMVKAQFQDNLESHDLGGYKLYSIKMPQFQQLPRAPEQPGTETAPPALTYAYFSFAVVDGFFAAGDEKLVRGLIQGASAKGDNGSVRFYKTPLYTEAIRNMPEGAVGLSMTDISRYLKPLLEIFKSTNPARAPGAPGAEKKGGDPVDTFLRNLRYELMPSAEFLSSFFGTGISYTHQEKGNMVTRTIVRYPDDK